jgi:hypothetical protein
MQEKVKKMVLLQYSWRKGVKDLYNSFGDDPKNGSKRCMAAQHGRKTKATECQNGWA